MPFQAINLPLSTQTGGKDRLILEDAKFHLLSGRMHICDISEGRCVSWRYHSDKTAVVRKRT
jgi:hypothetical protein